MSDPFKKTIHQQLLKEGFQLVGYVNQKDAQFDDWLTPWLKKGYQGGMSWMEKHLHFQVDPCSIESWGKSVIVAGYPYHTRFPDIWEQDKNPISNYAWGKDYHVILKKKLINSVKALSKQIPEFQGRVCVDTVPIPEKVLAMKAGLGWIGKNSMLINQKLGSYLFLGEIITNLDLASSESVNDYCGTCQKCTEACPTKAINSDRTVDSNRCISYLTIEKRGDFSESEAKMLDYQVFGCDICQQVCPWNKHAPICDDPHFNCDIKWKELPWSQISEISESQFNLLKVRSPIKRAKYDGFQRNVKTTSLHRDESSD